MSLRTQLVLVGALGLVPALARAELPAGRWQLLAQQVPPSLAPGIEIDVPVTLRNTSGQQWSEAQRDRLAYHWYHADGRLLERDGLRTTLPAPLADGDAITLRARLRTPTAPGVYFLQFEPVREHRRWWGPTGNGRDVVIRVEVRSGDGDLAWSIDPSAPLPPLTAGQKVEVSLRLRNTGGAPWSPLTDDHLSYHWIDREGRRSEGLRTDLPGLVAPGQTVDLRAQLLAPTTPGLHTLVWEPVREHVRWFGPPRDGLAETTTRIGPLRDRFLLDIDTPAISADTPAEAVAIVTNLGDDWPADHGLALGYHWLRPDGSTLEFDGLRTPLPALASGEQTVVVASVRGPAETGPHLLAWEAVREHVGWYPPEQPVVVPVDVEPPLLAWSLLAAEWPWTVAVGREQTLRVRIRNTGRVDLSPETGDRLGYRWRDRDGGLLGEEGLRSELPGPLAPGERTSLDLRVSGPSRPGEHILELGLVREHVAWIAPSSATEPVAQPVQVLRRSDALQLAFLIATLALIVAARRKRLSPAALRRAPALWLWAASLLLGLSFTDLAAIPPWPGAAAIAASTASLPAILVLLAPARVRPLLAALLALLLATLLLADLLYMQLLGSIVPVQALIGAHQVGDIGASIAALVAPGYLWLAAPGLAGLLLALLWPPVPKTRPSRRAPIALALLAPIPAILALTVTMTGTLGTRVFSEQHSVARLGVLGAHAFDLLRTARERLLRGHLDATRRAEIERWFAARPPLPTDRDAGIARGANLLMIQAEAMQAWVIGAQHNGQQITPFLNQLRDRALHYTALADESAQGMTSDSEYATLNSQLPLGQGAVAFLRADNHFHTLAHALKDAGYSTLSAHPYKKGFWNRAVLHPRYGFDRSLFSEDLGPGQVIGWGLSDDAFFQRMLPELAAAPKPFFAFLVTLSLHHPYDHFPDALKQLELGALENTALGNYLHGMHHLDGALARLFAALEQLGLADTTMVAIYGDHDSRLPLSPELLTLAGVGNWTFATPLQQDRIAGLLVLPRAQVHAQVDTVGGHIDLAPTLLHYLGVPVPRSFIGRPLLPALPEGADHGFAVYADGSAIGDDHAFAAAGRGVGLGGACFEHPSWRSVPLRDCQPLIERAQTTLSMSRAVVDHDLARPLATP
jgi:phosphoglycerol transferase MdoB-like AlkP superfamily enzyme